MRPRRWTLVELLVTDIVPSEITVWSIPEIEGKVNAGLPWHTSSPLSPLPAKVNTLVVVGGGVLLDESKAWRHYHAPKVRLIAIPSIWGSGAEVSPIVVLNREGEKLIRLNKEFLPDVRVVWPELAEDLPVSLAKAACGDTWSHALEGFLSALSSPELRVEIANLIREMTVLPLSYDPRWFDVSPRACVAQAQSSVGLIHGIAHVLEGILSKDQPKAGWGHSRLCSLMLWPVMSFNAQASDKFSELLAEYNLEERVLFEICEQFFDAEAYETVLPVLEANWQTVLRDPCSRTNSALVRPKTLEYFTNKVFQ